MKMRTALFVAGKALAILFLSISALTASTLHVIVAADTLDPSIGESVKVDLNNFLSEAEKIATYSGLEMSKIEIKGSEHTKNGLISKVKGLSVSSDDAVLFYNSSHGFRFDSKATKWPFMATHDDQGLDIKWVFDQLSAKKPRLLLVMADVCNSVIPEGAVDVSIKRIASKNLKPGYVKLFAKDRAHILASSSVPGEYSYAYEDGGAFSLQFLDALHTAIDSGSPDWRTIMEDSVKPVAGGKQHPQYEINGAVSENTVAAANNGSDNTAADTGETTPSFDDSYCDDSDAVSDLPDEEEVLTDEDLGSIGSLLLALGNFVPSKASPAMSGKLAKAVNAGDAKAAAAAIQAGADPNGSSAGTPLLIVAASKGDLAMVKELVNAGARFDVKDSNGKTAWQVAKEKGRVPVMNYLSEKVRTTLLPGIKLYSAALKGDAAKLKKLAKEGAPLNYTDKSGLTALHQAAWRGNLDLVKYLVSKGANPNLSDSHGKTPLDLAKKKKRADVVKYLKGVTR